MSYKSEHKSEGRKNLERARKRMKEKQERSKKKTAEESLELYPGMGGINPENKIPEITKEKPKPRGRRRRLLRRTSGRK